MIPDRTLILTDSAAVTEGGIYIWALQYFRRSIPKLNIEGLEPDSLRGRRADLFADNAVGIHRPGQTPSPVEKGGADLDLLLSRTLSYFFLYGKRADRPCGAYAAAEHTVVFTVTDPVDEDRCPYPLKSSLEQCRLDNVRRADLHTFPALDAPSEEVPFGDRARRSDHAVLRRGS